MASSSLTFRLVAAAGVWIGLALLVGGVFVLTFLESYAEDNLRERLRVHVDALIGASETDEATGRLLLVREPGDPRFDRPYSGWYWQISDGEGPILRSRSLWDQALPMSEPDLAGRADWLRVLGPDEQQLRLLAHDVTLPDDERLLRFSVATKEDVITDEIRPVRLTLIWSLAALGGGLLVALLLQVHFGLRPLRQMRRALEDVRAGRAERLESDFVKELAPIATELNALIDHNAAILDRARRHLGNLAHGLKTPLSVLRNEAAVHKMVEAGLLSQQVQLMTRLVDRHLARARSAGSGRVLGARAPLAPVVESLRRTLLRIHMDKALDISSDVAADAVFAGEREDLEEILGNLMDNAAKWARTAVRVKALSADKALNITIDDDGPGLPEDQRQQALQRGTRLDESEPGSGLGLAIAVDLVRLYAGTIELKTAPTGGLRVSVSLPAA